MGYQYEESKKHSQNAFLLISSQYLFVFVNGVQVYLCIGSVSNILSASWHDVLKLPPGTYKPSTGRRNSYEHGRADTCSPGYAQYLGWLESQNESWPQVVSTMITYAWRTLHTGMIQYYETLARSSESIRRGKGADETAFLSMHETSMDAFFHLFRKK